MKRTKIICTMGPNTNDKTIFIATSDTIKFIKAIGHQVEIIDL